jgi:hypothetical protein
LNGICRRPGPVGLVGCDSGTLVIASRCNTRNGCTRSSGERAVIAGTTTGADGAFSLSIENTDVGRMLLFEADVSGTSVTLYRTLRFGPAGPFDLAAADETGGGAGTAEIIIDPSSEGAVRLLSRLPGECDPSAPPSGPTLACEPTIDQTSNLSVTRIIESARTASNGGTAYAGMTDEGAAETGMGLAADVAGAVTFQTVYRAADGTVYQLLQTVGFVPLNLRDPANGEVHRINSVVGSSSEPRSCLAVGGAPGERLVAYTGVEAPGVIHPITATERTGVLTKPTTSDPTFAPQGSGRLTIGSGASALNICAAAADCDTEGTTVPLMLVTAFAGGIGAGCVSADMPPCRPPGTLAEALAFGLPSDEGDQCTAELTTETTTCGTVPADGFSLSAGQAVVFIYEDVGATAFSAGFSYMSIDFDGRNAIGCADHTVYSGRVQTDSLPPP